MLITQAQSSRELASVLRKLITRFVIRPVQGLTGSQVYPRAELTVSFNAWAQPGESVPTPISVALDLFRYPAHIVNLSRIIAAKRAHPKDSLHALADWIDDPSVNYMTIKRALDYARQMKLEGLTDPFRVLTAKPDRAARWRHERRAAPEPPAA